MKKKYTFKSHKYRIINLMLFLLVGLFGVLGIGFATLQTTLNISGSLTVKKYTIPVLKQTSYNDTTAFRNSTYRDKIKIINLDDEINPPANVIASWDVGANQNGDVMAYITANANDNTKYDLTIQGDGALYANPDSKYLFYNLTGVDSINNIDALNTSMVTNMSCMFQATGKNSTIFTLDLGNNFDTSNVTTMFSMFYETGYSSTAFTLDLGDKFDTSSVTDMTSMFLTTGYRSNVFTLDLGNHFDTSNVTNMLQLFYKTGYSSPVFTLNLGDNFDTSNVTNMSGMFNSTGYSNTTFTLNLGNKFDTSNVTNMSSMFHSTGYKSTVFTINLGNSFDTSKVTNMFGMFTYSGRNSTVYTLNLGNNFEHQIPAL